MIDYDYDTLKETRRGRRFDHLTALLIGIVAVLAASLAVIQQTQSLTQARAQAQSRRLASELTSRIIASGTLDDYGLVNSQRAVLVTIEGLARSQAALSGTDAAEGPIGQAVTNAGMRVQAMAEAMGVAPGRDGPLDPYATMVLRSTLDDMRLLLAVQRAVTDAGDVASSDGNESVMGLSLVALAGVFTGLAAVVGSGRTGRALLLLAWTCAAGASVLLVLSAGLVR